MADNAERLAEIRERWANTIAPGRGDVEFLLSELDARDARIADLEAENLALVKELYIEAGIWRGGV